MTGRFFELTSNAPDVEKGLSGLIRTFGGTNEAVKRTQEEVLKLTNAHTSLLAQIDRTNEKHRALQEQMRSGTMSTDELVEAKKREAQLMKQGEALSEKAAQSSEKISAAQKRLTDVTTQSGSAFKAFGQSIGDFAAHPLQSAQAGMTNLFEMLGPTAVAIGGTAMAVIGLGAAFVKLGISAAEELEHLQNLSAQTGLTTQDLQALDQIGKELGLDNLNLGRTLGMLNTQLALGKGEFVDVLKELGITIKGQNLISLIDELGARMAAIESPTERAQFANQVLGGRLRELIPILAETKGHLADWNEEMKRTGPIITEEMKPGLEKLNSFMDKFGRSVSNAAMITKSAIGDIIGRSSDVWKFYFVDETTGLPSIRKEFELLSRASLEAAGEARTFAISEEVLAGWAKEAQEALKKQAEETNKLAVSELFLANTVMKSLGTEIGKVIEKQDKLRESRLAMQKFTAPGDPFAAMEQSAHAAASLANTAAIDAARKTSGGIDAVSAAWIKSWDAQREQALKSVATIRDAAGHVFDSMLASGKSVFESLADLFKSTFLTAARTVFQNMMQMVFAPGSSTAGLFGGVFGQMGGGGGTGTGTGNWLGRLLGIGGAAANVSPATTAPVTMYGEFAKPAAVTMYGAAGTMPLTAGSSFLGVGGRAGAGLQAGAMMGGTMAVADAWKRGGAAGAIEGTLGGAAMGAAIGSSIAPGIGTAIGAAVGALGGMLVGLFGGGERARQRELERRTRVQEGYLSEMPESATFSGAFGKSGEVQIETDIRGKTVERRPVQIVFNAPVYGMDDFERKVNQILLTGGGPLRDGVAYAAS